MTLGELTKQYRAKKKWSQGQLATYTGLSQGFISRLENGNYKTAEPAVLQRIAEALNAPLPEFLEAAGVVGAGATLTGRPPLVNDLANAGVPEAELDELARIWPDLTEEDRQTALNVTRALWERSQGRKNRRAQKTGPKREPAASG